ncbi:autotransporter assembly complex protein TamA [Piscinibacter sakaiensis]|uniref:autotransporter assembly complex protein TamA n=1 Tax=Piscinibacter sakaiensis TaxID=1547922 RepID=UPI003AAEB9CE
MSRICRALLTACVMLALGGCSSLPWSKKKDEAAPAAQQPQKLREMYHLKVVAPSDQEDLLSEYLDLARFRRAPESEAITPAELDRLIAGAPAQARSLVETQGYFNSQASARRDGVAKDGLPQVVVTLEPGPRTIVREVELEAKGHLKEAAQANDPLARATIAEMRSQWKLKPGEPFTQSAWDGAKGDALTVLRIDGYPTANWETTSARIDADRNSASLYGLADSGPLFHFGEIRVEGLQNYRESDVINLATFRPGQRYSEKALLDTQDRLLRSGLFEGAVVAIEPDAAFAAAAPVTARVREQPLQQVTLGVGYADQTGERITVEHTHRRVFGRTFFGHQWTSKNKIELGRVNQSWQGDLSSHPLPGGWRNLIGGSLSKEEAAGTITEAAKLRIGRAVETERIDRLIYLEMQQASAETAGTTLRSRALSGNYHWIWRDLDDVLLPTKGWAANIESAVGYAWADALENGSFGRLKGRLTGFRPIGSTWFGSARLELAQVFAGDRVGVPDTLLFRAGGDDSVRGYAYRSLGPLLNGAVSSGRVLMTASGEVARPVSRKLPQVWWALFVDAGHAADKWGQLRPVFGYGTGVRYRSPVGPLRLDLAYAEELRKFRFHLSVGVAF